MIQPTIEHDFRQRISKEIKNLIPLFRYLILQTETHAFCLALAGAALLGFFPSCLVMLAIFRNVLKWNNAYTVLLSTLRAYFPIHHDFVVRNLNIVALRMGRRSQLTSLLWVLLGAAGVFVPLETALNRLWKIQEDRPYWLNQIVGFTLTVVCAMLGLFFLSISTAFHAVINHLPFEIVRLAMRLIVIHVTMTCFFVVAVFALYKFLPNRKIDTQRVLPAAVLAGIMAEVVRLVYINVIPDLEPTQGPFATSVTFLLLVYFETFVLLGCAFLATETERYPWMGFLTRKRSDSPSR
jgi:membrane protein/epoxyqueuosine reductase